MSREILASCDRIDAGDRPREGMTKSGIATSGPALTNFVYAAVYENPNRRDNYLRG